MNSIDELARLLKKLPGMGEKSAMRLAYHFINAREADNKALAEAIATIQERIHPCPVCGCYTEGNGCSYCDDPKRDKTQLCIVEQPQDVVTISNAGIFSGEFHVLGGAINLMNGVGPDALRFKELRERIDSGNYKEIIIATNPTEEGNTTALYIKRMLENREDLTLSRLASGIPVGGDLGYVDKKTLTLSMRGRIKL